MLAIRPMMIFALLAALAATPALAQNWKPRPGLWEMQSTMKTGSGKLEAAMAQMQEQLAAMPPEQREQMQKMFKQQGMSLPQPGAPMTIKVCMTQKEIDAERLPMREGCTQKRTQTGPNTMKVSFQCPGGNGEPPSSGEGTVTMKGSTAFDGQYRMNVTSHGQTEQMDMTQQGRWLGADCGQIKPMR